MALMDNLQNGVTGLLGLMTGEPNVTTTATKNIMNNAYQEDLLNKQKMQNQTNNNVNNARGIFNKFNQGGASITDNAVNQATNNAILGNLNKNVIGNAPVFNPNQPNTSPLQTVSPYQMKKDLSQPFNPQVNDWANRGINENQQRFDSAVNNADKNAYDMYNGNIGDLLFNARLSRNNNTRAKVANEQLSNDKRYASTNLENNNSLLFNDLNSRRNADMETAKINNDVANVNNNASTSQFNRQLNTYNANINNIRDMQDNQYKQGLLALDQQRLQPQMQQMEIKNKLMSDLQGLEDTKTNRQKWADANKDIINSAIKNGDINSMNQLEQNYNNYLQRQRDAVYNNPIYAINGIMNPRAGIQPKATVTIDANGNKQVEWKDVTQGSPLLNLPNDKNGNPVYVNSNVQGGVF